MDDGDKSYIAIKTSGSNVRPPPLDIIIISQPVSVVDEEDGGSLGSYVEDNRLHLNENVDKDGASGGGGKHIVTLKEKNENLLKIVTTLARTYSISLKEIIPLTDIPLEYKSKVIKNLVKFHETNENLCYMIVLNGEQGVMNEIVETSDITITRIARTRRSDLPEFEDKALNVLEIQQIEELKRKLNVSSTSPSTVPAATTVAADGGGVGNSKTPSFVKNKACKSYTIFVF